MRAFFERIFLFQKTKIFIWKRLTDKFWSPNSLLNSDDDALMCHFLLWCWSTKSKHWKQCLKRKQNEFNANLMKALFFKICVNQSDSINQII